MSELFPPELFDEAKRLLAQLQRHALLIATAESCTGGLLAGLLTEVPGASAMVERGFVTYSNASKTELLGVDKALIERYGESYVNALGLQQVARSYLALWGLGE